MKTRKKQHFIREKHNFISEATSETQHFLPLNALYFNLLDLDRSTPPGLQSQWTAKEWIDTSKTQHLRYRIPICAPSSPKGIKILSPNNCRSTITGLGLAFLIKKSLE